MAQGELWKLVVYIRSLRNQIASNWRSKRILSLRRTTSARKLAKSATRRFTSIGRKRRWPTSSAIRASIPTPSFLTSQRTMSYRNSPRIKSLSFTEASGSSGTSRKSATTIFRCPLQWDIITRSGGHICRQAGNRLVGAVLSSRQHAAPHRPDLRRLPLGRLRHSHQASGGVECGLRTCHGPGSEHVAHPTRDNILNPAHMDYVAANDTCIQCHSQGQPAFNNPIEGKYYDWPVGYRRGTEAAGLLEAGRPHSGRDRLSLISPTAPRTRTACRATISCRA